jgi:hypothetical protein
MTGQKPAPPDAGAVVAGTVVVGEEGPVAGVLVAGVPVPDAAVVIGAPDGLSAHHRP